MMLTVLPANSGSRLCPGTTRNATRTSATIINEAAQTLTANTPQRDPAQVATENGTRMYQYCTIDGTDLLYTSSVEMGGVPMETQAVPLPQEWGRSAYRSFLQREGLPLIGGLAVDDLKRVEVAYWPRLDARGAYIQLTGAEDTDGAYVLEVPSGGATTAEQHLFEEVFFVVGGRGSTEIWNRAGARRSFEWQTGSLFAIPLNTFHRLHNGSGREPARLLAVTTAPLLMNLLHNVEFIFACPADLTDRFNGEDDYFSQPGTLYARPDSSQKSWETNFVAAMTRLRLHDWAARGCGGISTSTRARRLLATLPSGGGARSGRSHGTSTTRASTRTRKKAETRSNTPIRILGSTAASSNAARRMASR